MMTKEERKAIRARCDEINDEWETGFRDFREIARVCVHYLVRQDIPALLEALDRAEARAEKAEKTLRRAGYTDNGGELWKPPIGKKPDFDVADYWKARAEALEQAHVAVMDALYAAIPDDADLGNPMGEAYQIAGSVYCKAMLDAKKGGTEE